MWCLAPLEDSFQHKFMASRWFWSTLFLHLFLLGLFLGWSVHTTKTTPKRFLVRTVQLSAPNVERFSAPSVDSQPEEIVAEVEVRVEAGLPSPSTPIPQTLKEPICREPSQKELNQKELNQKKTTTKKTKLPEPQTDKVQVDKPKVEKPKVEKSKVNKIKSDKAISKQSKKKKAQEQPKVSATPKEQQSQQARREQTQREHVRLEHAQLEQARLEQSRQSNINKALSSLNSVTTSSTSLVAVADAAIVTPKKITKLQSDTLQFVQCEERNALPIGESRYVDDLVRRLKLQLKLPELGQVQIELTITKNGDVEKVVVKRSSSTKNEKMIAVTVSKTKFAPFKENFKGELHHTFSIILSNEVE